MKKEVDLRIISQKINKNDEHDNTRTKRGSSGFDGTQV